MKVVFHAIKIGQISIWIIFVASNCSIYDVKNPIFWFSGAHRHFILCTSIFDEILQIILIHVTISVKIVIPPGSLWTLQGTYKVFLKNFLSKNATYTANIRALGDTTFIRVPASAVLQLNL